MLKTAIPNQTPTTTKINWKRWLVILTILLLLSLAGTALGFYLSPIGARMRADVTAVPPVRGVTDVEMVADPQLNHRFTPAVIEVPVGTEVTWHFTEVDEDGMPVQHNVIFENFGSDVQATGQYAVTFDTPGEYTYTCTLHAFMDGKVIVTE